MITLALNTANSITCIALLENGAILAESSWQSANNEAEKLMPAINALLAENAKSFKDITSIAVVRGPGSFTGLRIGVTVANTIAYLNNCPLYALTTFDYLHFQNELPVLLFAGSGGVYFSPKRNSQAHLINLPELPAALNGIPKLTGDISDEQKKHLGKIEFITPEKSFGEIMLEFLAANMPANPPAQKIVEPLYIKEPAITKSKKITCFT